MNKTTRNAKRRKIGGAATKPTDPNIALLSDWRREVLARVRRLILAADPQIVEEVKWRKPSNPAGVPVWSRGGIICTGETYKTVVKLTFAQGAALADPARLFNASVEGNTRRAIDLSENDKLDEKAFQSLIRAAVKLNAAGDKTRALPARTPRRSIRD